MRPYLISYYAERNDECVDLECIVEADDILGAINIFLDNVRPIKRITSIREI